MCIYNVAMVPHDSIDLVYPRSVREDLHSAAKRSKWLAYRLAIIEAHGPPPADPNWQRRLAIFRRQKAAWEMYFDAARVVGLFEGPYGRDLLARLRSDEEDNFR